VSLRVTVLIAVHDGGAYFRQAIDSVLAQSLGDFELLVVDDASADGSGELAHSYDDARIRVLRNEQNLGQIPSLNRGLREARGPYIARLDADDTWQPELLERTAAVLDAEPSVALVGTWLDSVDEKGRLWSRTRGEIRSYAELVAAVLLDRFPFAHNSIVYRRDVVLELGGYDETLGAAEDKDLYRRLALARQEIRVVPEPLAVYLQHGEQMSRARAAVVAGSDELAYERFLTALGGGLPVRPLRALLRGEASYWDDPVGDAELTRLIAAVTDRLALDGEERRAAAAAVARRCAQLAAAGWVSGSPSYRSASRPLVRFARRHGGARERALLTLYPVALAASPVGSTVAGVRGRMRRSFRTGPLGGLRSRVRRSLVLRSLYARLVGRG
jgi:glycosyltransferase involved in cell wall biosynthesis